MELSDEDDSSDSTLTTKFIDSLGEEGIKIAAADTRPAIDFVGAEFATLHQTSCDIDVSQSQENILLPNLTEVISYLEASNENVCDLQVSDKAIGNDVVLGIDATTELLINQDKNDCDLKLSDNLEVGKEVVLEINAKTELSINHIENDCDYNLSDTLDLEKYCFVYEIDDTIPHDLGFELIELTVPVDESNANECNPKNIPLEFPAAGLGEGTVESDANCEQSEKYERGRRVAKKRLALPVPKDWSRNLSKAKRLRGEEYLGYRRQDPKSSNIVIHDTLRDAKSMGPPCSSPACIRYNTRKCSSVTEEQRRKVYQTFWNDLDSWDLKKMYVCNSVSIEKPRQRKINSDANRRSVTYAYRLKIESEMVPVCKTMFLNTLGLKFGSVRHWLECFAKSGNPNVAAPSNDHASVDTADDVDDPGEKPNTSGHITGNSRRARAHKSSYLTSFLSNLPKMPSHYCRKSTKKIYLRSDISTKESLHKLYIEKCREDGEEPLSYTQVMRKVKELNVGIFKPRKDRCDVCVSFEEKNITKEEFDLHHQKKEKARNEKEKDKENALKGHCHALCCDLMAVQFLPRIKASAAYYKLKLSVHNYTVYDLATADSKNYWFDESEATLSASTFASFLVDYVEEMLSKKVLPLVVIYSDGCGYQNRNSTMSNALLHLSVKKQVTIIQKFLLKGHTQMECDSVHSVIERKLDEGEGKVHLPSQYVNITEAARMKPFPYRSEYNMDHTRILNFSDKKTMCYLSIRPGRKPTDPCVNDLVWIQYDPDGTIKFKTDFDLLTPLPVRPKNVVLPEEFPMLNSKRIEIPLDKYNDLQSLKMLIPHDCRLFYDSLPKEGASRRKTQAQLKSSFLVKGAK